jgi:hypothetical protein
VADNDDVDVKLFLTVDALSVIGLVGDGGISSSWRGSPTTRTMHPLLETHPMMAVLCV